MKSGHGRPAAGTRHARAKAAPSVRPTAIHVSLVSVLTLGILFLAPVFFTPGQLAEEFEFPKVSLVVTGALLLFGWWIAAESSRLMSGPAKWLGALPGRIATAVRGDPLGAAVAAMLLSAMVSTIASLRPPLSVFGAPQSYAGLRTVAALVAVYYASRSLAGNPVWFRRLAQAAGAAAAVATAYSLVQILHLDPFTWRREAAFDGLIRSGSTVGHPNTLSAYLVTCLPLLAWLAIRARSRAESIGWTVVAGTSLFIVVASLSRGAWLGMAAAAATAILLALVAGLRPSRRPVMVGGAVLALVILVSLVTPMRGAVLMRSGQITDLSAPTTRTRVELWRAGLRMFRDHPVAGVGLDSYIAAFPPYRTSSLTQIEWGGTPAKAHNDLIQILATQGALGGLAALGIAIFCALALWRVARRGTPEARAAAIVCAAALAGYVASSLVGFGTVATSALAAALAGWAARAVQTGEARTAAGPARPIPSLAVGFAFASVLWFWLVAKPLRAELYLTDALRFSSGSPFRDELLEKAAASAPWDPRYPAELGRSLFYEALREGNAENRVTLVRRSRAALTKSIRIAPENGENRILYATTLSAQSVIEPRPNSKEEVREEFRRAVALDPLSPVVLIGAERGLIAAGLQGDARVLALRCAQAYPDYAPPLADLGAMALEAGRTAAAAETLGLAVRRKWREDVTGAANAWNDLARADLSLKAYRQAGEAADSALAHNPNLGQAFAIKEAAAKAMSGGK
jgi:O-antigen ligase/tetratricopeptide (TPR) repeat protein